MRFQARLTTLEERKSFVYLLARLVKSFHFLSCFFSYPDELKEFVTFAEYVGPQLIKPGSVSDLMKQIRQTEVVKAADPVIRGTVRAHRDDSLFLDGAFRGQVNSEIRVSYTDPGRYDELADSKNTDIGGIFDIMAVTVIQTHLGAAA